MVGQRLVTTEPRRQVPFGVLGILLKHSNRAEEFATEAIRQLAVVDTVAIVFF
jgi:hypothetical protein